MKRNSLKWISIALVCVVCASCKKSGGGSAKESKVTGSPSDPPVSIKPKWAAGKRYVMRMESAQTMQLPNFLAGRGAQQGTNNPPVENNFAQEYSLAITNAPDGNRGMEMEILSIELQAGRGDQQQINYDSRNKVVRDGGPMTEVFDRVVGGKVYYLVSPENKVLKVDGIKELFERMESTSEDPAANTPAGARGRGAARGAAGVMRGIYNEEVFKQMIEIAGGAPKNVRIGETWNETRDVTVPMMGKLIVSTTNTFRGWQEHDGQKCARVEVTGSMTASGDEPAAGAAPMGMAMQGGTISGHSWYSPDSGISIETSIDQNYTLSMGGGQFGRPAEPGPAGNPNAERSFSVPVRQRVLVKLLEVKAASQ